MKSKLTVRRKPMKNRSRLFLIYTAAFLLCAAGVYACFIVKGRSLVVSGDGWKQHFTAFVYFGQYGRTVLRTLLTEHQLVLPQWNFSLGYGGDILTTLHYYVIGDPLDLLSIACPTRYAVYLYSFLSLFRLYLAGLGFGAFCLYKKQGAPLSIAVGGVCYVFFTYSFLMVARHPFFALPMVYLPLLLLGVEQVLAKRRPYLFIFTVFLAAISNFYFFYMLALITAMYTVFRLCCLYDRHSAKQAVGRLLQVTLWAVVGALMSAAVLLPVVLAFMNDTRTAGYQFNWFYDAKFYKNFLSTYFTSSGELGSQTYLGFNAIAFPAICLLFFKREPEEKPMRILFILSTLLLLFPAFGWLLNGLSYATNRWIWAYSLLVAYIVATQWQKLRHITVGQAVACVGALALYSLLAIPLMTTDTRNIGVSVLLAFLIIVLCALAPKFKKKHLATALVLVLVLTSFAGNAAYFYSSHGKHKTDTFVATEKVNRRIKGASGRKVKKAAKKRQILLPLHRRQCGVQRGTAGPYERLVLLLEPAKSQCSTICQQRPRQPRGEQLSLQSTEQHRRRCNALTGVKVLCRRRQVDRPHCPTALRRSKVKGLSKAATPCPWATPMTVPLPGRIMKSFPRWRSNKPCCKGWYWTACPPARHKPLCPLRTSPCPTPSPQTKMWQ